MLQEKVNESQNKLVGGSRSKWWTVGLLLHNATKIFLTFLIFVARPKKCVGRRDAERRTCGVNPKVEGTVASRTEAETRDSRFI